jgi:hypothetical protein
VGEVGFGKCVAGKFFENNFWEKLFAKFFQNFSCESFGSLKNILKIFCGIFSATGKNFLPGFRKFF